MFCSASVVYTSLWRGLKYLLKVLYIIQYYPKVAVFFIFKALCINRLKTLPYVWKNIPKMIGRLTHIPTKLSQNVYLINTHILIYRYTRCDCKLWNASWFYCVFKEFSYIIDENPCLEYCIFHQTFTDCVFLSFRAFSGNFNILLHVWHVLTILYQLCVKAEV